MLMSKLRAGVRASSAAAILSVAAVIFVTTCSVSAFAVDYTWSSATTGGLWSGTANWTPNGTVSGSTNTATLGDATADRTVSIDSSVIIGTLTLTQTTANVTNLLDIQRTSTVSGATSLGATSGTTRIFVNAQPLGTANVSLFGTGGITLNSGGVLSMGVYNPTASTVYYGDVNSNVTVQGGSLVVDQIVRLGSAGSTTNTLTGTLTVTSGTLAFLNATTGGASVDRRLTVSGLSITGGVVTGLANGATIQWNSVGTGTFSPASSQNVQISLGASGSQSLVLGVDPSVVARGTGVKTVSSSLSGQNIRQIQLVDGASSAAGTTFKLGSNLTLVSGQTMPNASANSVVGSSRLDVGIDSASFTLDLTANSGVFTPNSPFVTGSTGTTTYWALTGTAGRIVANGFNFGGTGTTSVATSVGPGLILESKAGNNVANTLSLASGTGSIDLTSIFRYSGAAAAATPSTLTSTRSIGDVEVTSGALRISSLAGLQAVRVTGGTLDLGGNALTVTSGSFGGGTVQSGTLSTVGLFTASSGTISAALIGSGSFAKVGSGTTTLSGTNAFAGSTTISSGVLIVTTSAALPGIVTPGGFSVASGATLEVTSGVDTAAVEGMLATGNFAAGSLAEIDTTGGSRTIAAALGGSYGLQKSGGNVLTLTGSNSYTGGTVVAGGTLQFGEGGSIDGGIVNQGVLAFNRSGSLALVGVISGTGSLLQSSTAGVVTLSGANSYTGGTTVNTGTIVVQGDQSAATGGWFLPNTNDPARAATFSAGSTVVTAAGKIVQLGLLSSSGSNSVALTVLGSSTNNGGLAIARNSTLTIGSGGTWLQTGTMQVSPQGGPATTLNVNAGGLFTFAGPDTIKLNPASNNSGNGTIAIAGGTFVTSAGFEQVVSSTSAGVPTLALSAGGLLRLTQDVASLTTPIASGSGNLLRMTLGSGGGTIDTNGFSTAIGVAMSGAGGLTKAGFGTLTLSGSTLYTGTTFVSAGTLALDAAAGISSSTFDVGAAGTLAFAGITSGSLPGLRGSGSVVLTNTAAAAVALTVGGAGSSTFDGTISGLGGLTKVGSGTFALAGAQSYEGGTTISAGMLQIGNSGTTGAVMGAIVNDGVLVFNRSNNFTATNSISGSGLVRQNGGGQLTLSGANTYSGGTLITGTGALLVSNAAQIGSGTITLQTSGASTAAVLELQNLTLPNPIVLAQTSINRNNITVGSGTATLTGPITITGTGAGVNVFYNAGSTSTSMVIGGNITSGSAFTGALSFRRNTMLITGTINTPSAGFDLNSSGTTTLVSTGNVWSYTIFQASSNVLRLGANDAHPTNTIMQFSGNTTGGGLDLNGFSQSLPGFFNVSGSIPAPLARIYNDAGTNSTLTLAGMTQDRWSNVALADGTGGGKVTLVMNSAGRTQTLASATSSYTGGTTIVAGTIALGHGNGVGGGGPLAVNGGGLDLRGFSPTVGALSGSAGGLITSGSAGVAMLTVSSVSNSTFAGLIENGLGTVGLTKAGSGELTLTAANTYTGLTNVNAGTLLVNGSLAGEVATLVNAVLGGSGSVGAISGGGLVGPGNSPGILTAPSVDPSGGLDFAFEFTQATPNYASASSSDNDVLWLTDSTPFTSSLTGANTVSIYLTQSAAALSELTGGFFTATSGDFFASISGASFQYFVQDAAGTFSYNGQAYKTLAQYDPSKSISVATVGANGGQVTQFVIVPEPGALVLAGVGAAAAAWAARRRRNS
jgi:fibronectin-binding autotransporter adhesin